MRHVGQPLDGSARTASVRDRSGVDSGCDVVLYSELENQAALDVYATHPEHFRVKQELGHLRIARHQVDDATAWPVVADVVYQEVLS